MARDLTAGDCDDINNSEALEAKFADSQRENDLLRIEELKTLVAKIKTQGIHSGINHWIIKYDLNSEISFDNIRNTYKDLIKSLTTPLNTGFVVQLDQIEHFLVSISEDDRWKRRREVLAMSEALFDIEGLPLPSYDMACNIIDEMRDLSLYQTIKEAVDSEDPDRFKVLDELKSFICNEYLIACKDCLNNRTQINVRLNHGDSFKLYEMLDWFDHRNSVVFDKKITTFGTDVLPSQISRVIIEKEIKRMYLLCINEWQIQYIKQRIMHRLAFLKLNQESSRLVTAETFRQCLESEVKQHVIDEFNEKFKVNEALTEALWCEAIPTLNEVNDYMHKMSTKHEDDDEETKLRLELLNATL